ncbi:hypothetical protein [Oerskovia enterophila]|uniref:Terminase small subunit n=1 Tax=Oerskovia enterophila TaxID=43678 RepID=A0ABX2Y3D4_9CELL|nr:hypothetical protein [Oerskovia enterophila]OCI31060.1 hypothetical protein OERS_22700 [Oerskovia enterophila]
MADEARFGARGQRLYDALTEGVTEEARLVLAEEAARVADRLDELDRIIAGKGVLELMRFRIPHAFEGGDEITVEVKFDNVLGESRQQINALRQVLMTLGVGKGATTEPEQTPTKSPLDELRERREKQRAGGS